MSDRQSWLLSLVVAAIVSLVCLGAFRAGVEQGRASATEEAHAQNDSVPGLLLLNASPTDAELEQNARESLSGMQREFERMKRQLRQSQYEIERLKDELDDDNSLAKN